MTFLKLFSKLDTYPKFFAAFILLVLLGRLMSHLQKISDFYDLNTLAVARDIQPYVSVYNPFLKTNQLTQAEKDIL